MLKKIIILLLLSLTTSCGYEPMYSKKNLLLKTNFSITSMKFTGDRDVNLKIKNLLSQYATNIKDEDFTLNLKTEFLRTVISNDKKGNPSKYKMQVNVLVIVVRSKDDKKISLKFTKDHNYNNLPDVSLLRSDERQIKNNLAELITNELLLKLIRFDDY